MTGGVEDPLETRRRYPERFVGFDDGCSDRRSLDEIERTG